jgi:DNA polymerase III delta' subunit
LSRSLLFAGPEGVGKWAAALWVARTLLCRVPNDGEPCGSCRDCARVTAGTHPDLHLLFPVPGKTAEEAAGEFLQAKAADPFAVVRFDKRPYITLERIRELIGELSKTAVEGGAKVVIIHSVEQTADDDCQSVLLKTIEEPPPGAHFILTSAAPERLLPTIHSRCQTVRFVPVSPEVIAERLSAEHGVEPADAEIISRLSGGGWGNALRLADEDNQNWRRLMIEFWDGAFRVRPHQLLAQIDPTFRQGKKGAGFDLMMQAYDVWAWCLWRDCRAVAAGGQPSGAPVADLESAWACWRILQTGRASLYVNVIDRLAVAGTFLAMRKRLRLS